MSDVLIAKLLIQGCNGVKFSNLNILSCEYAPRSVIVPTGVVGLCDGCFSGQCDLVCITLPRSIKYVGDSVLGNCTNLKVIRLPIELKCYASLLLSGTEARIDYVYSGRKL